MINNDQDAETMAIATISLFFEALFSRESARRHEQGATSVEMRRKSDNRSNASEEHRNNNVNDKTMMTMMIVMRAILATVAANTYA